ncbi:hypothetical protein DFH94DRAFT_348028 [Russula ochroleuca]|jgi:hypothetical protein|uniref:Uncharacterized protein n=1 Tax=Russula ochroleuca TaxID=152965 RepID=A0A9P5JWI4_9AGAM|nr:hypothetical protein DFH94DRAFT_348028 [Russula ochroleuca]
MYLGTRFVVLASLCLIVKLGCIAFLLELQAASSPSRYCTTHFPIFCNHTVTHAGVQAYVGSDRPRTWDIGFLPPVRMNIEPTKHYQLSGQNADAEWAALAPNDGILHLGLERQPYSVSLFHQLRCLDIIRRDIVGSLPSEDSKLSRHCLNYMRQMVLCRADLAVDPVLGRAHEARVRADTNQCVDWRRVYDELEKNQREYARWAAAEH